MNQRALLIKSIRLKRRLITFAYHLLFLVITIIGINRMNEFLLTIGILHIFTFPILPISRLLEQWLINTATCYSCGHKIDLVDLWRCSCSFIQPFPRHIFTPCQQCGKSIAFIICPRCDTGLLI